MLPNFHSVKKSLPLRATRSLGVFECRVSLGGRVCLAADGQLAFQSHAADVVESPSGVTDLGKQFAPPVRVDSDGAEGFPSFRIDKGDAFGSDVSNLNRFSSNVALNGQFENPVALFILPVGGERHHFESLPLHGFSVEKNSDSVD